MMLTVYLNRFHFPSLQNMSQRRKSFSPVAFRQIPIDEDTGQQNKSPDGLLVLDSTSSNRSRVKRHLIIFALFATVSLSLFHSNLPGLGFDNLKAYYSSMFSDPIAANETSSQYTTISPLISNFTETSGILSFSLSLSSSSSIAVHPVYELIQRGKQAWKLKVEKQSKTLKDAVSEYRQRYKMEPPKGFDIWCVPRP
jgi:hypothetical protein